MKPLVGMLASLCIVGTVVAAPAANPYASDPLTPADGPLIRNTPVIVMNWPAEQTVNGSVSMSNLPLDADGAVRVTAAPARQTVLLELISAPFWLQPGETFVSPVVNTAGYSRYGARFQGSSGLTFLPEWRWKDDDSSFGAVTNVFDGRDYSTPCQLSYPGRVICGVSGEELRFTVTNTNLVPYYYGSLKVYLIP